MMKKICNGMVASILIVLVMLASALFLPKVLGYETYAVVSGSMTPEISVGSIVYVKPTAFEKLEKGDIISFKISKDTQATHRIVEVDQKNKSFITKGDANESNDANPVTYQNVIGKVNFHLPWLGFLSVYIKTPLGIAVGCGLVFILILLSYLPDVFEKKK